MNKQKLKLFSIDKIASTIVSNEYCGRSVRVLLITVHKHPLLAFSRKISLNASLWKERADIYRVYHLDIYVSSIFIRSKEKKSNTDQSYLTDVVSGVR